MSKPTINTHPVANAYASPHERIIEFGNGKKSQEEHQGGLISFRNLQDGTLLISIYQQDEGVRVQGPAAIFAPVTYLGLGPG